MFRRAICAVCLVAIGATADAEFPKVVNVPEQFSQRT